MGPGDKPRDDSVVWSRLAYSSATSPTGRTSARSAVKQTRAVSPSRNSGRLDRKHTSELQSLMRISYAVFCLKKKKHINHTLQTFPNRTRHTSPTSLVCRQTLATINTYLPTTS